MHASKQNEQSPESHKITNKQKLKIIINSSFPLIFNITFKLNKNNRDPARFPHLYQHRIKNLQN